MEDSSAEPFSVAEKLDRLFTRIRENGRNEFTYSAVAKAIQEQQGVSISHTYIWQLRTGRRENPTIQHLSAIAKFFGVPVAYFLNDRETSKVESELELLSAIREAGVTEIALRAAALTADSRETISHMVRKVWELENGPRPEEK
ncbi:helix-turn-helix transcriptional regulator [Actinoplanes sp. NPDC026619]|uniref:helix-turn-helix domain-containing protein n=1 Tax=Actinoplanes sp. NPDC026619 TaxID=3155798 RepID=UPI0033D01408